MANKKLIILVDNSLDTTGAFNSLLRNIEDLQNEFDFVFIIPSKSTNDIILKERGFECHKINMIEISRRPLDILLYFPLLIKNAYYLSKIVDKYKANIVHVNDVYNMIGIVGKFWNKYKLYTHIRRMPESFPQFIYRIWHKLHLKFTDVLLAVSNANTFYFKAHNKVVVVYDKILDNEKYEPYKIRNERDIRLLYLANYTQGKGHEHALRLLELLKKEGFANVKLNFYGGDFGLAKNKEYKNKLITLADKLRVQEQVKFNNKITDVEKIMKEHDIGLNLSDSESFSNVSLEALYYGLPLMATNVGGTSEMFEHEQSGILVEKYDFKIMVKYLKSLIEDKEMRANLSSNGKKFVRNKFGYRYTSQILNNLYKDA